tara:strand:+ start:1239 stop:1355 length:117 start_codon:yes stop_codon:yes gene_type:complete
MYKEMNHEKNRYFEDAVVEQQRAVLYCIVGGAVWRSLA